MYACIVHSFSVPVFRFDIILTPVSLATARKNVSMIKDSRYEDVCAMPANLAGFHSPFISVSVMFVYRIFGNT